MADARLRAYDTFKHGSRWALQTPDGYVIEVEPKPLKISPTEYQSASAQRSDACDWSRDDFERQMMAGGVFGIVRVREDAAPLSIEMFDRWLAQFARPIYIRDMGATVLGPIDESSWVSDVGPGSNIVLDGGADEPLSHPTSAKRRP